MALSRLNLPARKLRHHYRSAGVFAYATESCFGIGGDPLKIKALRKTLSLKHRPKRKGLIVIAASLKQLLPLLEPLSLAEQIRLSQFWPGPYTFLLPAGRNIPALLRGRHRTLAVRVTAHPQARALCELLGPLVSTSANRMGSKPLKNTRTSRRFLGSRTLVVTGQIGKNRHPSTIIDFVTGQVHRAAP